MWFGDEPILFVSASARKSVIRTSPSFSFTSPTRITSRIRASDWGTKPIGARSESSSVSALIATSLPSVEQVAIRS